jgi:outer membrane protein TolC
MKKLTLYALIFLFHFSPLYPQGVLRLTLNDALKLAQEQSLQAFLNKHYYMADYWAFKSYQADYRPSVNMVATPISYSNGSQLRYNSVKMVDEFIRTENISSNLNLNVLQKVALTGGTISAQSNLSRIEDFGKDGFTQYNSQPFRIGYQQQLFGFNSMKWDRKIEPLKFKLAKKEYVQSIEDMNLTTVNYFFAMARASVQKEISQSNVDNTKKLLQVAQSRFELGTVTRDELLDLRLSHNNALIALQEAMLEYRQANENLLNFLMLPQGSELTIELPHRITLEQVEVQKVLQKALENNTELLQLEQNTLEGKRNVEIAKVARHFRSDVDVSFGLSKNDGTYKSSGTLENVYTPVFDNYQYVSVGVTIPILDWGRAKGQYEMARSNLQVTEVAAQKSIQKFEQNAVTSAITFNIQKSKLESAALSDTLANESYELTMTRFNTGKADVLKLTSTQQAKENARLQYINAMANYWYNYYQIRRLTHYDFEKESTIEFMEETLHSVKNRKR